MVTHLFFRLFLLPNIYRQNPLGTILSNVSYISLGFWLWPLLSLKIRLDSLLKLYLLESKSPLNPMRQLSFACCKQKPWPLAIFPLTVFFTQVIQLIRVQPHSLRSLHVRRYLAFIVHTHKSPSVWSLLIGILEIVSSGRDSYWMATPREGLEEESFHGGSIMMTSKRRCPNSSCLVLRYSKLKVLMSVQTGTESLSTKDVRLQVSLSYSLQTRSQQTIFSSIVLNSFSSQSILLGSLSICRS